MFPIRSLPTTHADYRPAAPRWLRSRPAQVGLLIVFWLVGDVIARRSGLPVPGAVVGLFLVLALLGTRQLSLGAVQGGAKWFLGEMLLFFVPAVLALLDHPEFLGVLGLKLLLAIVVGTTVVMTVTALTIDACYRWIVARDGTYARR